MVKDHPTSTAVWIVRESARPLGVALARLLGAALQPTNACEVPLEISNREQFIRLFPTANQWVLVMAAGIATRYLAGLPKSKHSDPAVVVLDEACRFAIPILSGHEGGGNLLAQRIAELTGAIPVITTATEALKPLTVGIGCRRGVLADKIKHAVEFSLKTINASVEQVREVATVDIKASEPGLQQWIQATSIPLRVFSTKQLSQRPITATPSEWVRKSVGLSGVCEPCALLASPRGHLIFPKTAVNGVTVAIVSDSPEYLEFL